MSDRFNEFFDLLITLEGGYSNRDSDAGGKTNYGITQYTYNDLANRYGLNDLDVKNLTLDQAKEVYRRFFYEFVERNDNKEIHYNFFDSFVNGGIGAYIELRNAVMRKENVYYSRESRYRIIAAHNPTTGSPNLKGWLNRLDRIKNYFKVNKG